MLISTIKDVSTIDVVSSLACIIFLPFCNLRCPWCQNAEIVLGKIVKDVKKEALQEILEDVSRFVEYVQVSGGEPVLHPHTIKEIFKIAKDIGLKTSVDTNGTRPLVIRDLIREKLLDHLAIDIKHKFNDTLYAKAIGIKYPGISLLVKKTIEITLKHNIPVEARTTVIPGLHETNDLLEIASELEKIKSKYKGRRLVYVLQQFIPPENPLDEKFKHLRPLSVDEMIKIARQIIRKYDLEIYLRTLSFTRKIH